MKRCAVILAIVTVMGLMLRADASPSFMSVTVSPAEASAEPSIAVDLSAGAYKGTIYYTAPGASALFVSNDGGINWHKGPSGIENGGDADVAVDAAGNVFSSALFGPNGGVEVQTLAPGATSIVRSVELFPGDPNVGNDPTSAAISCDRQWTAARATNHVVTSAVCNGDQIWVSDNGWQTVEGPFTVDANAFAAGPLTYAPNGHLFQTISLDDGFYVARSTDGGRTWTEKKASSDFDDGLGFANIAADQAGNLYLVYATSATTADGSGGGAMVFLLMSSDDGQTWSPPLALSPQTPSRIAGNTPSSIFPWVSAGAVGKVAVTWYQANDNIRPAVQGETDFLPDTDLPTTTWDVVVARNDNALAGSGWTSSTAVTNFHAGSICTFGLACLGPQNLGLVNAPTPFDRRVLDFFETAISPTGQLYIAYPLDRPIKPTSLGSILFSDMDFMLARQTGGASLQ